MKTFILSLILLLSISFTTQANTIDYEKPDITVTDQFNVDLLQVSADFTIERNDNYHQGLDVFQIGSCRYDASFTGSRQSDNITFAQSINFSTSGNKEQTRYSFIKQNWQPDTSRMRVFGITSSRQSLQTNYRSSEGNYYLSKGKNTSYYQSDELLSESVFSNRNNCSPLYRPIDNCKVCSALHA